jgi:hypothetical protein
MKRKTLAIGKARATAPAAKGERQIKGKEEELCHGRGKSNSTSRRREKCSKEENCFIGKAREAAQGGGRKGALPWERQEQYHQKHKQKGKKRIVVLGEEGAVAV